MISFRNLTTSLLFSTFLVSNVSAQDAVALDAEIATVSAQIVEADATIANFGGLIRSLAQARREALLLLRTVIESRKQAAAGGVPLEISLQAVQADPLRADALLGEMAAQKERVVEAEREASTAGGLIQALAMSRVETEKLTLAQLQMAYVQARYGIAFPSPAEVSAAPSTPSATGSIAAGASTVDNAVDTALLWADPRYPEIDYSLQPFEQAHANGQRISGWWTIEEERAAIDDSPLVTAINYSAYDPRSYGGATGIVAQCREGETSIVFVQDEFLMSDLERSSFEINYRINEAPAQTTRWRELSSNKGAGIFGSGAEEFLRGLYNAEVLFIRLTDGNGQRRDAELDLAGAKDSIDAVAMACGWSTFDLSREDYVAIQTMLNAGGFNAGSPDGVWGKSSRDALRTFQMKNGLPTTGALDGATLEALDVSTVK